MIRRNFHSLDQIETMGVATLHAGIQLEIIATLLARLFDQPIEKLAPESARPILRACDQIVDIKKLPGKERFEKPVTGDG
ncbi:MAG: hypothetical protein QOE73_2601, partial [Verrucomicrobiota bacterium]